MPPSILFIEDEEALRMTVGDLLRKEGYAVEYAHDGDGLQKAATIPFDLIILDVMLPRRDGFSVCELLFSNVLAALNTTATYRKVKQAEGKTGPHRIK